jgi:NADH-quinone oxidoreductase subunit J
MDFVFYIAAAVAVASTAMVITRMYVVHALLYLVLSLLSVAVIFFALGAPFAAALEVMIYAGAIMVLFVFVIMMLNLGDAAAAQERQWVQPGMWLGPTILALVLAGELLYILAHPASDPSATAGVDPKQIGIMLFGPYLIGVELAAMLLLAGLVGAYHLGRRRHTIEGQIDRQVEERDGYDPDGAWALSGRHPVRAGTDRPVGTP